MNLTYGNTYQPPFNIIENIFYVGTKFVSSHLFTSPKGHILIDAGMPKDGATILENIEKLGFRGRDIRYLLITHAHIDHLGGAAHVVKETGASACIGEADVPIAEHGPIERYDKFGNKTRVDISSKVMAHKKQYLVNFEPIEIVRRIKDGEHLEIGTTAIEFFHTPGHTAGSFGFGFQVESNGKKYRGFLPGGIGANVFGDNFIKDNISGANINAYIDSLKRMKKMDVDVWLGAHPFFNNTLEKWERLRKRNSNVNPFIDPEGGKVFLYHWLKEAENVLSRLKRMGK
ncbi:MAG: MBL fold metallo-hydrolase [Planctomycetes bacterium]|nr:MBL fold metallo-hydrolase [Planctomycetota bacterium]